MPVRGVPRREERMATARIDRVIGDLGELLT